MGQERHWVGSCRPTSTAQPPQTPLGFGLRTRSRARGQKSTCRLLCASDSQNSPSTDTEPTCKEGFVWPKVEPFCCFLFCDNAMIIIHNSPSLLPLHSPRSHKDIYVPNKPRAGSKCLCLFGVNKENPIHGSFMAAYESGTL